VAANTPLNLSRSLIPTPQLRAAPWSQIPSRAPRSPRAAAVRRVPSRCRRFPTLRRLHSRAARDGWERGST